MSAGSSRSETEVRRRRFFFLLAAALVMMATGARVLPRPWLVNRAGMSQIVLARDGTLLRLGLSSDDHYRVWTPLAEIPNTVVDATLLAEDRFFFRHPGVNPIALMRAFVHSVVLRDRRVGASTVTMQLARLRFDLDTRSAIGKLRQILAALVLELRYSKREILEAYLNLAPYGANVEGIGAASWVWFGKPPSVLTPAEAVSLVVIPKSPRVRTPLLASGQMAISEARAHLATRMGIAAAALAAVRFRRRDELPYRAPHFADRVTAEHPESARLETTLEPRLQSLVESRVASFLDGSRRFGIRNASVLVVDHRTMDVLAYVGSADHADAALQGAVDGVRARRSPGSALKPLLYGLALDAGLIHPETMLEDTSLTISAWNPENFDHDFIGPISATDALVRSRNLPAVYLANRLPSPGLYGLLARAGVGGLKPAGYYGLALALGGVEVRLDELVGLYATLARGGRSTPLRLLTSAAPTAEGATLLTKEASYLVLDMLRTNPRPGEEIGALHVRRQQPVAWKTGTSFGFRDAWAVGVGGRFVIGVWLGNFDSTSNPALIGRDAAGPLFFRITDGLRAMGESMLAPLPPPALARTEVCALTGAVPGPQCAGHRTTWVMPGTSPITPCRVHRAIAIDEGTGLRACPGQTEGVRWEPYESWPSNLLALFRQAGIARRVPPPYPSTCATGGGGGLPLRIESPQPRVAYALRDGQNDSIPFSAVADADGRRVSWFVDDRFVGQSETGHVLFWPAQPGAFVVRAVDELGRSRTQPLRVELVSGAE